jgi:hypothetical protein
VIGVFILNSICKRDLYSYIVKISIDMSVGYQMYSVAVISHNTHTALMIEHRQTGIKVLKQTPWPLVRERTIPTDRPGIKVLYILIKIFNFTAPYNEVIECYPCT